MRISDDARRLDLDAYPFTLSLRARYSDCDTNAHVNNVAIASWYEAATVEFTMARVRDVGWVPTLIANVTIDYLADVPFPGTYDLGVGVVSVGRTSVVIGAGLFAAGLAGAGLVGAGRCLGLGNRTLVQVEDGRATAIADALRERWTSQQF